MQKDSREQKRTKIYDVWIHRNGKWLVVASQGISELE